MRRYLLILSVISVLMLATLNVGYAIVNTGTVQSVNNTISDVDFNIGLYSFDDYDALNPTDELTYDSTSFTTLSTALNGSIAYTEVDGNKTAKEDDYVLASGNVYLVIQEHNTPATNTYNMSLSAVFSDDNGVLSGITSGLFFAGSGEPVTPTTVFQPNTAYRVQINSSFPNISYVGTMTFSLSVDTVTVITTTVHGLYLEQGTCSMILVQDDPIMDLVEITTGDDVEGDYIKDLSTIDGCPQVQIINNTNTGGTGIADADGNISITLDIPANTPFCVKIWNKEEYDIRADINITNVVIDGVVKFHKYNNQKLGAGFARYFCHYYAYSSEYWSTTNLANVKTYDGWMQSADGTVTITIDAHYNDGEGNKAQNVNLYVIFKDD